MEKMEKIQSIQFHMGTREELLPGFSADFPYIATRAEIGGYAYRFVPWHWHKTVELFYMESGTLEYCIPGKRLVFPPGSGGFVNSNVLHMTRLQHEKSNVIQLLHIFDPSLIAGEHGGRIDQNYVMPVVTSSALDILAFYPDVPAQAEILAMIQNAFSIPEGNGFELRMRNALSSIWLSVLDQSTALPNSDRSRKTDDKLKQMMTYIYEHYAEKITISELAASAYLSQRECFRVFQENLHATPCEYLKNYRIQRACQMLAKTTATIAAIGYACGLGSNSHFGKVFRETIGCTPRQYREKWQDRESIWR